MGRYFKMKTVLIYIIILTRLANRLQNSIMNVKSHLSSGYLFLFTNGIYFKWKNYKTVFILDVISHLMILSRIYIYFVLK